MSGNQVETLLKGLPRTLWPYNTTKSVRCARKSGKFEFQLEKAMEEKGIDRASLTKALLDVCENKAITADKIDRAVSNWCQSLPATATTATATTATTTTTTMAEAASSNDDTQLGLQSSPSLHPTPSTAINRSLLKRKSPGTTVASTSTKRRSTVRATPGPSRSSRPVAEPSPDPIASTSQADDDDHPPLSLVLDLWAQAHAARRPVQAAKRAVADLEQRLAAAQEYQDKSQAALDAFKATMQAIEPPPGSTVGNSPAAVSLQPGGPDGMYETWMERSTTAVYELDQTLLSANATLKRTSRAYSTRLLALRATADLATSSARVLAMVSEINDDVAALKKESNVKAESKPVLSREAAGGSAKGKERAREAETETEMETGEMEPEASTETRRTRQSMGV